MRAVDGGDKLYKYKVRLGNENGRQGGDLVANIAKDDDKYPVLWRHYFSALCSVLPDFLVYSYKTIMSVVEEGSVNLFHEFIVM